jgi:HAD superfamily hydrolase (TIGR01662 family)
MGQVTIDRRPAELKLVAFDFGHTLVDERQDAAAPIEIQPVRMMPDVLEVLPQVRLPMAVWANTRTAGESAVRHVLAGAGIEHFFKWIVTSVDAGVRKPAPGFFEFALERCGVTRDEVLFVGNQLNSDVAGGARSGIRTVWLSAADYRSDDDDVSENVTPTFTIRRLAELPALLNEIGAAPAG